MIKISHEIPKQLFPLHDLICDYPYVLAHLLLKSGKYYDKEYANFYKKVIKESDFSIMDNGVFELGYSIDVDDLLALVEEYKPTHVIAPDVLLNKQRSMDSFFNFFRRYDNSKYNVFPTKIISVLQGSKMDDYIESYLTYSQYSIVDLIAIPFDCSADGEFNRIDVVYEIYKHLEVFSPKKLHLLGCLKPSEFSYYSQEVKQRLINSIDTSSPIVCGWSGIKYNNTGYDEPKPKDKLAENLDINISDEDFKIIAHNVKTFKTFVR